MSSRNPARDAARALRLAARGGRRPGRDRCHAAGSRTVWQQVWDSLAPVDPYRSIKAALGLLVITSVVVTTLLVTVAIHSDTELRVITVFSIITSLWLMQWVATWLTAPLREMTAVTRAMAQGDYSRRVRTERRDELGVLAVAFNSMAADLQASDRHRKELVANVSHELRTPISGLRALLENVVDGVSEADPETMRAALAQTERLGRLVADLLDLSRLDSGVVPLNAHRFEVWPFLSGLLKAASIKPGVAMASHPSSRNDVHLHLDVSPPELTGYADPERLYQVVSNLVDNAVRHSPPSGRVTVRARRGEMGENADGLELEVLDEGPGIPRAQRSKVFERFGRGDVPAPHGSGSDGGTGLGLAIARWAVELHGGRIRVAESDRGCRMHLTLPGKMSPGD